MKLRKRIKVNLLAACTILSLSLVSVGAQENWPSEEEALRVAEEVKIMMSVGTAIIGGLQPALNAGNPDPALIEQGFLVQQFLDKYSHTTGTPLDLDAVGLLGKSRREFLESYKATLKDHEQILAVGGVDSFVPAYFRSEVFAQFNERLDGKVKGYATNREADLLNPDWGIDALMDYSLFAYYIREMLEVQETEPLLKSVAGRVVGYYPMKLKQGCVSCHARQGLEQEVGAFGGALITEVLLSD